MPKGCVSAPGAAHTTEKRSTRKPMTNSTKRLNPVTEREELVMAALHTVCDLVGTGSDADALVALIYVFCERALQSDYSPADTLEMMWPRQLPRPWSAEYWPEARDTRDSTAIAEDTAAFLQERAEHRALLANRPREEWEDKPLR